MPQIFSALTDLLVELIATPSVNPVHSTDPEIHGEKRMADLLSKLMDTRGLEVERLSTLGNERPAVIGRSRPAHVTSTLIVEMHLDTVGVAHMQIPPFEATIADGRLYGRGSCDMKGSMASFFHALTPARIQTLGDRGIQLIVVGAPGEETGLEGSKKLVAGGVGADFAIILEPTQCQPVIAHKSTHRYEVELLGRSGHGSQPEKGVSTNAALATFLPALFQIHQKLVESYLHPLLGKSTMNIGKIAGGHIYNIIPERTILQIDRRVIPQEPAHLFPKQVEALIAELVQQGQLLSGHCPLKSQSVSFATEDDCFLVKALQSSIERISGEPAVPFGTSWVSDASSFSQTCGQTLVFGPGNIDQAHTENEYIELNELERGSEILADFLDTFSPVKT